MNSMSRRYGLITHIALSVGWLGAVIPYLVLAIVGLTSHRPSVVQSVYLCLDLIGWYAIVPLSLAALASGLVQSLATPWGLIRYWWILVKAALTLLATSVLLHHMQVVDEVARLAARGGSATPKFHLLQFQLLVHPAAGMLVLLAILALSVLKPWGKTPFGRDAAVTPKMSEQARHPLQTNGGAVRKAVAFPWRRVLAYHALGLFVLSVIIAHLSMRSQGPR